MIQQHEHVIPGQLIAVSSGTTTSNDDDNNNENNMITSSDDSFLRGHGTYIEVINNQQHLYSSVVGIVQRVNKLISVQTISYTTFYRGQVGDLIIGRVLSIGNGMWKINLGSGKHAILPIQGIHLPGGIQRIRTAEDKLDMKQYLDIGDIISAEVHKIVHHGGSSSSNSLGSGDGSGIIRLHTRSVKYGKLENGCMVTVPNSLIPRRKNHYTEILNKTFNILYGCNGMIWIQRNNNMSNATSTPSKMDIDDNDENDNDNDNNTDDADYNNENNNNNINNDSFLVDIQEQRRAEHISMPYSIEERCILARIRNCIICLRMIQHTITNEVIETLYDNSIQLLPNNNKISKMLLPNNIILLTSFTRK